MSIDPQKTEIFDRAAEIGDPLKRARFLDEACGDDAELRADIEDLLLHDAADDNPLDQPIASSVLGANLPPLLNRQIGPYTIRAQIGEGGFGQVYIAEQARPIRRQVALKLIKPGMGSRSIVARFEAERQALALMNHPHVAKVLDAGTTDDGRPFFVMELVRGEPITDFCDDHKLSLEARLQLFMDTCAAVQHAHQKGIIHRDLKPSNIMVSMQGEKPHVKVIDFGVAKALYQPLTENSFHTAVGQMIGTPAYMSPEQAELNEVDIDTRSDVYTLGVLLYELLTGTTPFDSKTLNRAGFDEMRRIIREDEPIKPSARLSSLSAEQTRDSSGPNRKSTQKLSRTLRGDLDWIVMKALEKDRERRYESPRAFADDIERFLGGQSVHARPPSLSYRLSKFSKRHRGKLAGAALLITVVCAFGWWEVVQSYRHLDDMTRVAAQLRIEKEKAEKAEQRERRTSYISQMKLAFQRFEDERFMETSLILARQIPVEGESDLRGVEWHYLNNKLKSQFRVIGNHTAEVRNLDLFPDGKRVVAAGTDGVLTIWEIATGTQLKRFELHHRPIHAVAVSPDGRWIAYGEEDYPKDSHVVVIDAESGAKLAWLNQSPYTIRSLDFSADGKYLVSASNGEVAVWEFLDGLAGELHKLPGTSHIRDSARFDDDGITLMTFESDTKSIALWDVSRQTLIHRIKNLTGSLSVKYAYNASRQWAAYSLSRGYKGSRSRVDWVDGSQERIKQRKSSIFKRIPCEGRECVAFSQDGMSLLVGSYNGWMESWKIQPKSTGGVPSFDVAPCQRRRVVNGTVTAIRNLDENSALVSGSDGAIVLYRFGSPVTDHSFAPDDMRVASFASSNDARLFAWQGTDNRVRLTEYATGKLLDLSDALPEFARTLVFSPDGTLLAAQCDEHFLQYWDVSQGKLQRLGHGRFGIDTGSRAWSHVAIDRQHVIGFSEELDKLYFADTNDISRIDRTLPEAFARSILLSPDGRTLAAAYLDLRIYDRATLTLQGHFADAGEVYSMAFSDDSRWLASGHYDGAVRLRNLSDRSTAYRLDGHNYAVRAMAFTRDGTRLITGDGRGYVGFWDVATGECYGLCLEVPATGDWIRNISIGPHDRWLDLTAGHGKIPLRTRRLPLTCCESPIVQPVLRLNLPTRSAGYAGQEKVHNKPSSGRQGHSAGLVSYDGFEYESGKLGSRNGGLGFRRGWTGLSSLTGSSNAVVVDEDIGIDAGHSESTGKCILMEGKTTLSRGLVTKIDLSKPGRYYVSLLAKRLSTEQPDSGGNENLEVVLMNHDAEPIIDFGMSSGRRIHVRRFDGSTAIPQDDSRPQQTVLDEIAYLLLLKIEMTADSDGHLFALGCIAGIPYGEEIPHDVDQVRWSGTGLELPADQTIDRLRITNGKLGKYLIDELRIGTTYESVIGPLAPVALH